MKRSVILSVLLLLTAVLLGGCADRRQAVSSAPSEPPVVFVPAQVTPADEITAAFDSALGNAMTTLDMVETYDTYRLEWEKAVRAYAESIDTFANATVQSNQVIDGKTPPELGKWVKQRQKETEDNCRQENERYTQEQAQGDTGSIAAVNHAAALYEIQKNFALELAGVYDQIAK